MAESQADRGARYTAFISYSHKDAAGARWLHRRLEAYRLPKRLVGTGGRNRPVPARLTPVFRDREDLPAAGDLSETVRAALAASENLVVICSPYAAASLWVGREIALFRELHPGRPVYAAILDGEPPHCFPAELTAGGSVEPLAADLRGKGDGRRLGFLKLAAGLAGVGLDALVQRDAQRRMRRVMAVTAAALAAMLVMAVLTTIALTARAEADRQRAEAEGLVEFMLTDLRRTLRGVGRLDAMQAVNARALSYYGEDADLAEMAPDSLKRWARIYHSIGEDALAAGDLDAALGAYRKASRVTGEQVARRPNDAAILFVHARSDYGIGRVHELREEWPAAKARYARFAAATERMIGAEPNNPDFMVKVAAAAIDLGNVELNGMKNYPGAQLHYQRAISWLVKAAAVRPADRDIQFKLADAHGWLADSDYAQAQWQQSLAARREQLRIVLQVAEAAPTHQEGIFRVAVAERAIAHSELKLGYKDAARAHLFSAHRRAQRLSGHDPDNGEWLLLSGMIGCDLLFAKLGLPPGTGKSGVVRGVLQTHRRLAEKHDPRGKLLQRCAAAIGSNEIEHGTGRETS